MSIKRSAEYWELESERMWGIFMSNYGRYSRAHSFTKWLMCCIKEWEIRGDHD